MIAVTNNKILILLITLVGGVITALYFVNNKTVKDTDIEEQDKVEIRKEIFSLTTDLETAKKIGDSKKVEQIEKEIETRLPDNLKRVLSHIKDNTFDLDFYGRVVDQNGMPVINAKLSYSVTTKYKFGTTSRGIAETDQNGMFSIKVSGYTLSLRMPVHPKLSDKFIPGTAKLPFKQGQSILLEPNDVGSGIQSWKGNSENNPYIIRAWRIEKFENILHDRFNIAVTADGELNTYIKDNKDNKMYAVTGYDPNGYLTISCSRSEDGYINKTGSWSVNIAAIKGGILKTNELILNEVPLDDGYQSSTNINMQENQKNYSSRLRDQRYYFTSHNGKVNGSLVITYKPFSKKEFCLMSIDYKINTDGSRNIAIK